MNSVPNWTYEFHSHRCPFMPIGFRMGQLAMRILGPEFMDGMARFEFFKYRKAGKEPSEIPAVVTNEVVEWMFAQPEEALFIVERKPDFTFQPVKGSFNKAKCVKCGEYVFERYVRLVDGEPHCIPCAGYER